jgi:hypothetical protein
MKLNRFLSVVYAITACAFLVTSVSAVFEAKSLLSGLLLPGALFIISAITAYAAWKRWHKPDRPLTEANHTKRRIPLSIAKAIIYAVLSFTVDTLILNQFTFSFLTTFIVIPIILSRAIFDRKDRQILKIRLITAGIFSLMVILIITANHLNNQLAHQRTLSLSMACEKYKAERGDYPDSLYDLVPLYISEVPPAKYSFIFSNFHYVATKDYHVIGFYVFPPFGRITYTLENRSWGEID